MYNLSDNYFHRKCYFEREQVPTQTVMKDKMCGGSLARVYFKSMNRNLKILAGFEPPMRGGGSEWFKPPEELLAGRAVLKPVELEHLKLLGFDGLNFFGEKAKARHYAAMKEEKRRALEESDVKWKNTIIFTNRQHYEDRAKLEVRANSAKLRYALEEFENMYRTFVTKTEDIVLNAAITEIKRIREEAYDHMNKEYKELLHCQATRMYNEYEEELNMEKTRLKAEFTKNVEEIRTDMANRIHDINFEKHLAIEKLRHFLQCQNLACQVYVALKEKEECEREINIAKHDHNKKIKGMKDDSQVKDFEIHLEIEEQLKRQEFNRIWKKKICHIVKKFQFFVEYCLKLLPEHADFFLNMEKLMMLQLGEASENPVAESVIEHASGFTTPVARPHPFYLFCDKVFKPQFEQKLCPEHCTSSASHLPVIVINKRCIYAACDNFEKFTEKVCKYLYGVRGDDTDMEDNHDYNLDVPVKYTSSTQLQELKLESSLMQVLQEASPNIRKLPVDCCICKIPYCFCSPLKMSRIDFKIKDEVKPEVNVKSLDPGKTITRNSVLQLQREPKWESYLNYVETKKCRCAKTAKKHLREHLPPYMRNTSQYEPPELPNYETCTLEALKRMVKKARGVRTPPPPPDKVPSKTRDMSTQYSDQELEFMCTCFSDEEISNLYKALQGSYLLDNRAVPIATDIVDGSISGTYMDKSWSTFATQRAFSLRHLIDDNSELEQIFNNKDCLPFEN